MTWLLKRLLLRVADNDNTPPGQALAAAGMWGMLERFGTWGTINRARKVIGWRGLLKAVAGILRRRNA